MKIEIKNGKISAIPENDRDLMVIINSLRRSGNKKIISFGIKKGKKC